MNKLDVTFFQRRPHKGFNYSLEAIFADLRKQLAKEVEEVQNKGSYLTKVVQMKSYLATFDGLGDFIPLLRKLDELEVFLRELIQNNQIMTKVVFLNFLVFSADFIVFLD